MAYSGMQTRAVKSSLTQSLNATVKRIEADKVLRGTYATSLDTLQGSTDSSSDETTYRYTSDGTAFCLTATQRHLSIYVSSTSSLPTGGACDGHEASSDEPITDPVVHTQTGSFDTRQPAAGGGVDVPITIDYDLQPTDYVFILYNAGYRTKMKLTAPNGTTMQPLYTKSMGASGYQQHIAYGISGLTGRQTIEANACWSVQCHEYTSVVEAGYIVYVVRGLGSSPVVTATSTAYGTNPPEGSQFGPTAQSLNTHQLAIFSYVYYGNKTPGFVDKSSPSLTWKVDATSGNTAQSQVAARHTYATSASNVEYAMVIPTGSSARYSGAILFTIK